MASSMMTSNRSEISELIEWDLPLNNDQNGEIEFNNDFSKLSMGTELRNKMWEDDNKDIFSYQRDSSNSPLFDQNQNLTNDMSSHYMSNGSRNVNLSRGQSNNTVSDMFTSSNISSYGKYQQANVTTSQMILGKPQMRSQPLLQSPIPMPNDRNTPELLSNQEDSFLFDGKKSNESQTIKEELLEMKSIFTKLAAQTEDITGLPEPVQLALKVIKLEGCLQERDLKIQNLEEEALSLKNISEKDKRDHDFQIAKLKKEYYFLKEKLDYKTNLDASTRGQGRQKDEKTTEQQEIGNLEKLIEEKEQQLKELEDYKSESEHNIRMLTFDVSNSEKEVQHLKDVINEQQTSEQNRKNEIEHYITAVRESMERERQDRYLLLVEQNKLKHKVEKLSENCKSYQMKNEELCRIQNELEQECDQFRKLKKMIHEHGLPNHEQLILLQQQTEMFKDDVITERKDRERAQAQREKMRRDLEILQSRNQSLQEQVYKYQEHIMRLNTGDRRQPQNQEFLQMGHQVTHHRPPSHQQQQQQQHNSSNWVNTPEYIGGKGSSKFARQLSSPAYFNPKICMDANMASLMKNSQINVPSISPVGGNRQGSPINEVNQNRDLNGFPNNVQGRAPIRRPQGFGNQFDPWQQRNGLQQPVIQQHRNTLGGAMNNGSRAPHSPLLGPNGDPWLVPPSPNVTTQHQLRQIGTGLGYTSNIWSQQTTAIPFNNNIRSSVPDSVPNWQYSDVSSNFTAVPADDVQQKAVPGGETWSTVTDDVNLPASNTGTVVDSEYHGSSVDEAVENTSPSHGVGGFQCGKCNTKFHDTEAFRGHAEKCFN